MMTTPYWIAVLSALLTPVVAVLLGYLAYLQFRLGREKLNVDLYDKRFAVFSVTRMFLIDTGLSITRHRDESDVLKYQSVVANAAFLFNAEIAAFVHEIYERAQRIINLKRKLGQDVSPRERSELTAKLYRESSWVLAQLDFLERRFAPYLKFDSPHHRGQR